MKENLFWVLILIAVFTRVIWWKKERDRNWNACTEQSEKLSALAVEGDIEALGNGEGKLSHVGGGDFSSEVEISLELNATMHWDEFGRRYAFRGVVPCKLLPLNFASEEDFIGRYRRARMKPNIRKGKNRLLEQKVTLETKARGALLSLLFSPFEKNPGLLGFEKAVWTGASAGFSPVILDFYREGGLLQILALSGQHVNALLLLIHFILGRISKGFLKISGFRKSYRYLTLLLPVFCSLLLSFTSLWSASMVRTLGMALAFSILRFRRYCASVTQILSSSLAWLLLWDPSLISGPGFLLSASATYLIIQLGQEVPDKSVYLEYAAISICMPILILPSTAFFFGKIASWGSLINFAIAWFWDLFLIPVGFLLPLSGFLPISIRNVFLDWLEGLWQQFLSLHQFAAAWVSGQYLSVPRPTVVELLLVEMQLVILLVMLCRIFKRESRKIVG